MPKPSQIQKTQQKRGDAKAAQRWTEAMMRNRDRHERERQDREQLVDKKKNINKLSGNAERAP